jgi:type IV secretion system protein VirB6
MACSSLAPSSGFIGSMLDFVDCQAQAIGAGGYQALAAPGSTLSLVLTGLLTLFVALFGYRMLFGQVPTTRDGVLALVKFGIVLALATSWAAYRTLVYDVALKGPAELATDIGGPAAVPGAGGGLVARLDNADRLLQALAAWGTGDTAQGAAAAPRAPLPPYLTPGPATGVPPPAAAAAANPEAPSGSFDGLALGAARILFLTVAAGALAALRLIAGVLLALGPFFFAFLLFDGTRGLFEGWLRVLGGAALGALGAAILLGIQLAFIEPRLATLISLRASGYAIPGAAVELFVIMLVFAVAMVAMVIAAARVAYGFRFPDSWRVLPAQWAQSVGTSEARVSATSRETIREPAAERSRAAAVADAVAASQRREVPVPAAAALVAAPGVASGAPSRAATPPAGTARDEPPPPPQPLGQSYRRTRSRASASAGRRDVRA